MRYSVSHNPSPARTEESFSTSFDDRTNIPSSMASVNSISDDDSACTYNLSPHLHKSSSSSSLPGCIPSQNSARNLLSPAFGESSEVVKTEALKKSLTEEPPPLTSAEQRLVQETWKVLEQNMADHGIALYLRLFEIAPAAKGLFAFGDDDEAPLEHDPTMRLHAAEVLKTLGLAACRTGQSLRVVGVLEKLGRRHVDYGATLETYAVVKEAFLYVLEKGLGENSCPEVLTAWSKAYESLVHDMKRGHCAVLAERNRAASLQRKQILGSKLGFWISKDRRRDTEKGHTWHGGTYFKPS